MTLGEEQRNVDPWPTSADRLRAFEHVSPTQLTSTSLLVHTSIATGGGCANREQRCLLELLLKAAYARCSWASKARSHGLQSTSHAFCTVYRRGLTDN